MSWLSKTFNSSIGKKIIMALTGLFLCSFLIIHLIGNLQILKDDGGEAFNLYAKFMTTNPLIKTVSYLLYSSILGHAFYGLFLAYQNKQARPQAYHSFENKSSWASRNMAILGTMILVFVAVHMHDFWWQYHNDGLPYKAYASEFGKALVVKDLYQLVWTAFKVEWIVAFYVISMVVLSYHLLHGFQSAFQTLGINHKKYTPFVQTFGFVFAIIIPAVFALIPFYVYFS
jgi:succinate dehydrogenase / fumarate reductase, cytochrome b subunit